MASDSHIERDADAEPVAKTGDDDRAGRGLRRRGLRRLLALVLLIAAIALLIGFGLFLRQVHGQLATDPATVEAEGIVVLTGGRARLEPAVDLLRQIDGARLLVSGVNADVSEETLRQTLGADEALFDCCIDIDRQALDTAGNAQYTADWAGAHAFERVAVVTNDYHMPRALMEMRRTMPDVTLVPFAVVNSPHGHTGLAQAADRYRVLAGEYGKFLIALARLT